MSLDDIIRGKKPLFRSTSRSNDIASIEQDYADLASKGGGPFYLNDRCATPRYQREVGASIEDIAEPRGSLNAAAVDQLLINRDALGSGVLTYFQFLSRLTYQLYTSTPVTAPGGAQGQEPYVFSDTIPEGKWRVVVSATGNWNAGAQNGGNNSANPVALWLLPPMTQAQAAPFAQVYNPALFLDNLSPTGGQNRQPLALGLRVDNTSQAANQGSGAPINIWTGEYGMEAPLLTKPILMPPGFTLCAFQPMVSVPIDHPTGLVLELRLMYVDMAASESLGFDLW